MNLLNDLTSDCSRRDFLRVTAGAAGAFALASLPFTAAAKAPISKSARISLKDCLAMSPVSMAEKSPYVQSSFEYLVKTANEIKDAEIRRTTVGILKNPAPTLMELYQSDSQKEILKQKLVAAGYLKPAANYDEFLPPSQSPAKTLMPFYAAPGSGYGSHHSYPGGLATHVGNNVKISLGLYNSYKDSYGSVMNRDIIIAAQTLHDLHKPWVFQWQENGASRTEYPIAGTGAHHTLSTAELIYRRQSPELIVAMAHAHSHSGTTKDEEHLVNYIKAAAIIAQQDPVAYGLLSKTGETVPIPRRGEGYITFLGDHDWIFSVPSAKWLIPQLGEIAKREYGMTNDDLKSHKFNSFRNYVFSQGPLENLYLIWAEEGEDALVSKVKSLVTV